MEGGCMSDEDDDFLSLGHLYFKEGITAGTLATAIEKVGVFGWDRFDRFKLFKLGAPECEQALDRLARRVAAANNPRDDDPDLDPSSDPFYFFGWRVSQRPDFEELTEDEEPPPPRRRSDDRKIATTDKLIIAAMLDAMEGRSACGRHPDFPTREKLIQHLAHYMQGYRGVGERTLQSRFSEARGLMDNPR